MLSNTMIISLIGGLLLAVIAYIVLNATLARKIIDDIPELREEREKREEDRKLKRSGVNKTRQRHGALFAAEKESTFEIFAKRLIPMNERTYADQEDRLHKAGVKSSPQAFWLRTVLIAIAIGLIAFIVVSIYMSIVQAFGIAFCSLLLFIVVMRSFISTKIQNRADSIERQMPMTLQLLSAITLAGSGLEQSFKYIADTQNNEFSRELALCQQEMSYGAASEVALKNMAERNNVEQLNMFCGAMVQGISEGMSISDILTQQAESMEQRQRMKTEELANKIPTKLLFPMMAGTFPTLFIALLAPALESVSKALSM